MSFIPFPIGRRIREIRQDADLKLRALQERCGVPFQRISEIERGESVPTPEQLESLARGLRVSVDRLTSDSDWLPPDLLERLRTHSGKVRALFRRRMRYRPSNEVSFGGRIEGLRTDFGDVLSGLENRIAQRPDVGDLRRLMAHLACDSGEEALFLYHLAGFGGNVARMKPKDVDFRRHAVYDPRARQEVSDYAFLGMELTYDGVPYAFLPQVPVMTKDRYRRLDILVIARLPAGNKFAAVEIDGQGHRAGRDEQKDASLSVPTVRIRTADLIRSDFVDIFFFRLRKVLKS